MNFGTMINPGRRVRSKQAVSELNLGSMFFFKHKNMIGVDDYEFHPIIFTLFDRVLTLDSLNTLSTEQKQVLLRYFYEAGKITDKLNGKNVDTDSIRTDVCTDLDRFLGASVEIMELQEELARLKKLNEKKEIDTAEYEKKFKEIEDSLKNLKAAINTSDDTLNSIMSSLVRTE